MEHNDSILAGNLFLEGKIVLRLLTFVLKKLMYESGPRNQLELLFVNYFSCEIILG